MTPSNRTIHPSPSLSRSDHNNAQPLPKSPDDDDETYPDINVEDVYKQFESIRDMLKKKEIKRDIS
jgi:hypothetical protein